MGLHYDEIALALREIYVTYGDDCSVLQKNKRLRKFGRSSVLQANVTGDITGNVNAAETYQTANLIDSVVSSSAADLLDPITIEGHTVDGNGDFTFVVQSVVLNGQTPVALTTPLARASRAFNTGTTGTVGTVYVYKSSATAVAAGVPTTAAARFLIIPTGKQQSFKCATTISNLDYYIITEIGGSVEKGTGSVAVDFELQVRQKGSVFRELFPFTAHNTGGAAHIEFIVPLIVPRNADIRMRGTASSNNTFASAWFAGHLASIGV